MFGLGKAKLVAEHEATDDVERVFHEVRQTLRTTGVGQIFEAWAAQGSLLPMVWEAMRANVETRAFEDAADGLRAEAVRSATSLGPLHTLDEIQLGDSQKMQLRAALDLYHYVNPKLLLFVSAVMLAMEQEPASHPAPTHGGAELIELGAPPRMAAWEMESEQPNDVAVETLFLDIKQTLASPFVPSDFRSLALWPDYLAAAWHRLKPVRSQSEFDSAAQRLREMARAQASALPYPVSLSRGDLDEAWHSAEEFVKEAGHVEESLAQQTISIALLALEWSEERELRQSPFPVGARRVLRGGGL